MDLLIDIGNTRLKWAHGDADGLTPGGSVEHYGQPLEALLAVQPSACESVWVSHVMDRNQELSLGDALRRVTGQPAQFARSAARLLGLRNAYSEPQRLGVDRWLAMLAAWSLSNGACVVADAGTALTVDCVDASGQHLGGIIAAGLQTSQRAVLGATRFDTRDAAGSYSGGLGSDTEACVRQGAVLSCIGAIDRAASVLQAEHPRCFLTGGDAQKLLPLLPPQWTHHPELVLQGLQLLARQTHAGRASAYRP